MSLDPHQFLPPLRELHALMRDAMHRHVSQASLESLSRADRYQGGDIIYSLDSRGEDILLPWCENFGRQSPFLLVCEGLPSGQQLFGTSEISGAEFVLICDPIDGTRPLMYDKRSAWLLLGVAPNVADPTLADIEIAVQGELPTSKAGWADCVWAWRGGGAHGESHNLFDGSTRDLRVQPSRAANIEGGFAMLSKFFVGSKGYLAALEERLIAELLGEPPNGSPQTFDDQYISNGGQLFEIMSGRDRFNADLRPVVHSRLFGNDSQRLCSHPYDLCTELIAREAGAHITDAFGEPLRAPLDVESPVSWIAYANDQIRAQVEPVLLRLLHE